MSWNAYKLSNEINKALYGFRGTSKGSYNTRFSALIMAAIYNANTIDCEKIKEIWPDLYSEFIQRRQAIDGLLPEELEPHKVNAEVETLAKKWGYNPNRRYEKRAGFDRITERQLYYIKLLIADRKLDYEELQVIFKGYWDIDDIHDLAKADAMFIIERLKSTELDSEAMTNNWFAQIVDQWRGGKGEGWWFEENKPGIEERWERRWDDTHLPYLIDDLDNGQAVVFWDRDIPRYPTSLKDDPSAVYLWFEFMPATERHIPIYIGRSSKVFNRLYTHYWTNQDSKVWSYICDRMFHHDGICEDCGQNKVTVYEEWVDEGAHNCNCLLRYWIALIPIPDEDLNTVEQKYIKKFGPKLNEVGQLMDSRPS